MAPDYSTAAQWYRKAADQGNSRAQINLGSLYERGLGVAKNKATALELVSQSIRLKLVISWRLLLLLMPWKARVQEAGQEATLRRQEADRLRNELAQTQNRLAEERRRRDATSAELVRARQRLQQQKTAASRSDPNTRCNAA